MFVQGAGVQLALSIWQLLIDGACLRVFVRARRPAGGNAIQVWIDLLQDTQHVVERSVLKHKDDDVLHGVCGHGQHRTSLDRPLQWEISKDATAFIVPDSGSYAEKKIFFLPNVGGKRNNPTST